MFGSSKPVVFDPYGRRRKRARVPRWLVLLLLGIAVGIAGVLVVQERYLPPRLSADASAKLQRDYEHADAERQRLTQALAENGRRLERALADAKRQAEELSASHATGQRLREDLAAVVDSLPPDPRNGSVEVRAARFGAKDGKLDYDVVLTRDNARGKALNAALQLAVAGESARGSETTVTLEPVEVSIGSHQVVHGNPALPAGFKPRQVTVRVLAGGKPVGMRVLPIQR